MEDNKRKEKERRRRQEKQDKQKLKSRMITYKKEVKEQYEEKKKQDMRECYKRAWEVAADMTMEAVRGACTLVRPADQDRPSGAPSVAAPDIRLEV